MVHRGYTHVCFDAQLLLVMALAICATATGEGEVDGFNDAEWTYNMIS